MALDSVAVITQVFIQNNTVYLIFIFIPVCISNATFSMQFNKQDNY